MRYKDFQFASVEGAKKMWENQKLKVEQEKYIEKLIFSDFVNSVRNLPSRYAFSEKFFADAHKEIGKKLKKDRPNLDLLNGMIVCDFFNEDRKFKITGIIACGMDTYGYDIVLKGYGKEVCIFIPRYRNITEKNIEFAKDGKYAFGVMDEGKSWSRTTLILDYDTEKIAQFIKEYFEEAHNESTN